MVFVRVWGSIGECLQGRESGPGVIQVHGAVSGADRGGRRPAVCVVCGGIGL